LKEKEKGKERERSKKEEEKLPSMLPGTERKKR